MDRVRGVHVRLPDGTEDVYTDVSTRRDRSPGARAVEHYYTLMKDGYLFVFRTEFGESNVDVVLHRRETVYAPGGWHRVRSLWVPFTGPSEFEHLPRYE